MKRILLFIAVAGGSIGLASPAHALTSSDPLVQDASTSNDLLNKVPGLGGDSTRHVCVIEATINRSYCVYVTLP